MQLFDVNKIFAHVSLFQEAGNYTWLTVINVFLIVYHPFIHLH